MPIPNGGSDIRHKAAMTAILLLACPLVRADEEYDQLLGELHAAEAKYSDRVHQYQEKMAAVEKDVAAEDDQFGNFPRPTYLRKFRPRFKAYAEKHAGEPAAIPALVWLATAPGQTAVNGADPEMTEALKTLTEHHAADPAIVESMQSLRSYSWVLGKKPLLKFFETVAQKNPSRDAQGWAQVNIARLKYGADELSMPGSVPKADTEKSRSEAAELFRKVVKEFPGTPIAQEAKPFIFEIENLQVGMIAPDLEGQDLDGNTIKLSQYRGKVVLLDFWGFW